MLSQVLLYDDCSRSNAPSVCFFFFNAGQRHQKQMVVGLAVEVEPSDSIPLHFVAVTDGSRGAV